MGDNDKRITNCRLWLLLPILLMLAGCNQHPKDGWELVYKNDQNGNTLMGDKTELLSAVRNGLPIRVGWGGQLRRDTTLTIEHLADASFITILNGTEVFAQLEQIIGQRPFFQEDSLKIRFRESNSWTKIVGSNGYNNGLMIDRPSDTVFSGNMDRTARTSWFVLKSGNSLNKPTPFWE